MTRQTVVTKGQCVCHRLLPGRLGGQEANVMMRTSPIRRKMKRGLNQIQRMMMMKEMITRQKTFFTGWLPTVRKKSRFRKHFQLITAKHVTKLKWRLTSQQQPQGQQQTLQQMTQEQEPRRAEAAIASQSLLVGPPRHNSNSPFLISEALHQISRTAIAVAVPNTLSQNSSPSNVQLSLPQDHLDS